MITGSLPPARVRGSSGRQSTHPAHPASGQEVVRGLDRGLGRGVKPRGSRAPRQGRPLTCLGLASPLERVVQRDEGERQRPLPICDQP